MKSKKDLFISPSRGKLTLNQVSDAIYQFLSDDPQSKYRLVIGSDSHERRFNGKKMANYITAIVVHRVGRGGRYFWTNGEKSRVSSIRQKIYQETMLSIDVAGKIVPILQKKLNGKNNWQLEIHIDVGRTGDTRDMIKEVVGMIVGNGYEAKIKPEAYAASCVADKHT